MVTVAVRPAEKEWVAIECNDSIGALGGGDGDGDARVRLPSDLRSADGRLLMLNSIILPLALIVQPTPNWHHARESAHASLLHVVSEQLRTSVTSRLSDLFIEAARRALHWSAAFRHNGGA